MLTARSMTPSVRATGRARPTRSLTSSGQHPGQAAGQGEVSGQPGPAGGQRHGHHGRDRGHRSELHHRQQWPTQRVGELVDQPEQVGIEGEHVAVVGGQGASRHDQAADQHPQHVPGVPPHVAQAGPAGMWACSSVLRAGRSASLPVRGRRAGAGGLLPRRAVGGRGPALTAARPAPRPAVGAPGRCSPCGAAEPAGHQDHRAGEGEGQQPGQDRPIGPGHHGSCRLDDLEVGSGPAARHLSRRRPHSDGASNSQAPSVGSAFVCQVRGDGHRCQRESIAGVHHCHLPSPGLVPWPAPRGCWCGRWRRWVGVGRGCGPGPHRRRCRPRSRVPTTARSGAPGRRGAR